MIQLDRKTLKVLTGVFWGGVALASVSLVLAITMGVIERRNSVRTQDAADPQTRIAVPAE